MFEQLEKAFQDYWAAKPHDSSIYHQARQGLSAFKKLGIPNRMKDENWKYTNLKPYFDASLKPYLPKKEINDDDFSQYLEAEAINIVFYNGYLVHISSAVEGLTITKIGGQDTQENDFGNGMEALQAAFSDQGVRVQLSRERIISQPLYVVFLVDDSIEQRMLNPTVWVELARGAELTIVESHQTILSTKKPCYFLSNIRVKATIGEQARLRYYKQQQHGLETVHLDHTKFALARSAYLETFNLSQGAKLCRYDLQISLTGEGAKTNLNAIYHPTDGQHVDHQTMVDHRVPHCISSQLYKGVVRDHSRLVFNGKVFIRLGAAGTDASQLNKNLLVGDRAEVDTKPQMEIDADDVKCSHGATIGSLDQEQVFYLESRGIERQQAEAMLASGFMGEVIQKITHKWVRERFKKSLEKYK